MAGTDARRVRRAAAAATGYSLLLVEDNPHHAEVIRRRLERSADGHVRLSHACTLAEALKRLGEGGVEAVLLDLVLPDSSIDETLPSVLEAFPGVPVIVLTSLDDMEFAASTVKDGAQGYLVKSQLTGELLFRSVRYAVERKKSEESLRRYAADLERSNEDLKQFAHTLAHEVKSPLAAVTGCLDLVRDEAERLGDANRELLVDASEAARDITELVDQLLAFATAERRGERRPVDLESVFYQAFVALRPEIKAAGARVTHDPLPTIAGDAFQLRHVLQNLIGNALKYRGSRTPEVHVGVEREEDGFRLFVRDNGIGIPPEHHGRVFDMFYRVHGPGPCGTGIGLAFCRRIVELHGGRIGVESEPGRGCMFWFTLPGEPAEPCYDGDSFAEGREGAPATAKAAR